MARVTAPTATGDFFGVTNLCIHSVIHSAIELPEESLLSPSHKKLLPPCFARGNVGLECGWPTMIVGTSPAGRDHPWSCQRVATRRTATRGWFWGATCDIAVSHVARFVHPRVLIGMSMTPYPLATYEDLKSRAVSFAQAKLPLVVLIGNPGLGKTETFKDACEGSPFLHISGNKRPFDLYIDLHRNIDKPVILDDVEPLMGKDEGKVLIRQLTETVSLKTVAWGSQTRILDNLDPPVPHSFLTRSPVCLVTNKWRSTGIMKAIESRAVLFDFTPSWIEAYKYAGTWFHDQEVLDFVHSNLAVMRNPDLRLLVKAKMLRDAGLEWQSLFDDCIGAGGGQSSERRKQAEVERLLALDLPMEERVRLFEGGGFGERATFYRHKKKILQAKSQVIPPRIVVSSKATSGATKASGATNKKTPTRVATKASRKPARAVALANPRVTTPASPKAKRKTRKTRRGRKPLPK